MSKNLKISLALIVFLFLVGWGGFLYVLKPYVTNSNKIGTKEKQICLESTQSSSEGLVNFLKTKIFGYDMLQAEITKLKKEVEYLNHALEARNK
jgi:hypothetical protein